MAIDTDTDWCSKQVLLIPTSTMWLQTIVDQYGFKIWNRYLSTIKFRACLHVELPDFIGKIVKSFRCFCFCKIGHRPLIKKIILFQDTFQRFKGAAGSVVCNFHHITNYFQIFIPSPTRTPLS